MPRLPELTFAGVVAQMRPFIKSCAYYTITIAANQTSGTASLSPAVDKNHAVALMNGVRSAETGILHSEDVPRVELTNDTTITATTNTANTTNSRIIEVCVVEWWPWAATVQHGTVTNAAGNALQTTALAAAVDESRSVCVHLGSTTTNASQSLLNSRSRINFTAGANGASVSAVRSGITGSVTVGYAAIQFARGIVKSRQLAVVTISSGTSGTATISAVNTDHSLLFWDGFRSSGGFQNGMPRAVLTNATTITVTRGGSTADTLVTGVTVLEFYSRWIKRKVSGQTTIGTGASETDATIAAVDTSKTMIGMLGFTTDTAAANMNTSYATVKLTSSTNVKSQRDSTSASLTTITSWNGMEFR
jgi:hypothetical protein